MRSPLVVALGTGVASVVVMSGTSYVVTAAGLAVVKRLNHKKRVRLGCFDKRSKTSPSN